MTLRRILHIPILIFFLLGSAQAQDLHYSQFFYAPLNISPALTGSSGADLRLSGNYKNQWAAVPVDYNTFSLGLEKLITPDLAAGLQLNYDQAGDLDLALMSLAANVSYRLRLDGRHSLAPAIGIAVHQRSIDFENARTESQWNGTGFDPTISSESFANDGNFYPDFNVGLNYRYEAMYRKYLNVGLGLYHINRANQSFDVPTSTAGIDIANRWTVYADGSVPISERLDILVGALYQSQSPYDELVLNARGKLYLNDNKARDKALMLGIGLRLKDAFYPIIGFQYENILASLSYDINFSDFDFVTNSRGGFELGVIYTIYKVPAVVFEPCPIY